MTRFRYQIVHMIGSLAVLACGLAASGELARACTSTGVSSHSASLSWVSDASCKSGSGYPRFSATTKFTIDGNNTATPAWIGVDYICKAALGPNVGNVKQVWPTTGGPFPETQQVACAASGSTRTETWTQTSQSLNAYTNVCYWPAPDGNLGLTYAEYFLTHRAGFGAYNGMSRTFANYDTASAILP